MSIVLAVLGIALGGMYWHFGGAVAGGVVGWLWGRVLGLTAEQRSVREELALLRQRLDNTSVETTRSVEPTRAREQAARPIVELSLDDMLQEAREPLAKARPTQALPERAESIRPQRKPAEPTPPSAVEEWLGHLFNGENLLVKVGTVILLFGVSFLVKYAVQRGLLPVQLRLAGAALGGIALVATGWRLRLQRREYGLTLQGGGIAILYITAFAAYRICGLVPAMPAFGLLTLTVGACCWLAVGQNARTLALFGLAGGFAAPLLCGIGSGNPALLFGYYALLNAGIAAIAWFRSWRILNLAGFIATFAVSLVWGSIYYRPLWFATVEPFLIYSFLLYVAVATLFALRQPPELRGVVDGTLVFGTPIAAFLLQALMVYDQEYGLAWSALVAGCFYLCISIVLQRTKETLAELVDAYRAFGVLFVTLAVPLAFDGRWTSAVWAVEGAGVAWAAGRRNRHAAMVFGLLLQLAAGIAFLTELHKPSGLLPVFNAICLGSLLLSLSGLLTARTLMADADDSPEWLLTTGRVATAWGFLWWFGGGLHEVQTFMAPELVAATWMLFLSISCWGWHLAGRILNWRGLGVPALLLTPVLALTAVVTAATHPFADGGWLAWPVAMASVWALLRLREDDAPEPLQPWLHGGACWLSVWLLTAEAGWQVRQLLQGRGDGEFISLAVPSLSALALIIAASRDTWWPVGRQRSAYLGLAALPLAAGCWCWSLAAAGLPGEGWPLPWLPILNALDLSTLAALFILYRWSERLAELPETEPISLVVRGPFTACIAASGFLWLNTLLARVLHHWGGIPYDLDELFRSSMAQTSFSIFWSLLALGAMFTAVRRCSRLLWSSGAVLLGVVVLKLFTVDLAGHGTVERIVSFVAVGLLLLVIGWLAPVPPQQHSLEVQP